MDFTLYSLGLFAENRLGGCQREFLNATSSSKVLGWA